MDQSKNEKKHGKEIRKKISKRKHISADLDQYIHRDLHR
jgi:hypothetical protein